VIVVDAGSPALSRLAVRQLRDGVPAAQIAVIDSGAGGCHDWYGVEVRAPGPDDLPIYSSDLFAGAERVLFTAERGSLHLQSQVDQAVAAGARRIVFAGIADEKWSEWWLEGSLLSAIEWSAVSRTEQASFVVLRMNLPSDSIAPAIALAGRSGELVCAFGDGLFAAPALTDCAEVAAAIVAGDGHDFQSYHLAGTIGLKPPGVAAIASRVTGRPLVAREVDPADLAGELRRGGADDALIAELERVYRIIRSGGAHNPGNQLAPLLGRSPATVEGAVRAALASDERGRPLGAQVPEPDPYY
jgi:NAD(P)H dehydrogenase (quinone)